MQIVTTEVDACHKDFRTLEFDLLVRAISGCSRVWRMVYSSQSQIVPSRRYEAIPDVITIR